MQAILGSRFRTLRKSLGLTQKQAAIALRYHPSKISRMETGDDGCRQEDVRKLLGEYRVDEAELARYLTWARYAGQSWWPDEADPEAGSALDALLDTAPVQRIRGYAQAIVPDLLQTPDYTRAVLRMVHDETPGSEIDRMLEFRLSERTSPDSGAAPEVWMLLEQSALERRIGGKTVWANQIAHLDRIARLPNVTLQIIGNNANEPARIGHGFSYLRFADIQLPDLVCIRQLTGVVCLDLPDSTDRYLKALDHLAANAATPRRTLEQLSGLLR